MGVHFSLLHKDLNSSARTGILHTDHGDIETPIFMPVGTAATVKGVMPNELVSSVQAEIILSNTYHLYLRPGADVLSAAGGLHKFMSWPKPILTDSGGYQVYSLSKLRKINEQGVTFASHIDGSKHFFTAESVMDIQLKLGADLIMAFDECPPYPCEYTYARKSMELTHRWLSRCFSHFNQANPPYDYSPALLPICQGSIYTELRQQSADYISQFDAPVNAIGGLSVGEPHDKMYEMTALVTEKLPVNKGRYLMGVGTPENILECISLGIDLFDCVLPSRNARHGLLYTTQGIINIKNAKWKYDQSPIDPGLENSISSGFTRSYLRHLVQNNELLAASIATIQNLAFYLNLVQTAREKIKEGNFVTWKNQIIPIIKNRIG